MGAKQIIGTWLFKRLGLTVDPKYVESVFRSLLRSGTMHEIQDEADAYVEEGYRGNPDIYSIVRRYINMSRQAELKLGKTDEEGNIEVVTDHELVKFIEDANPRMSQMELKEAYDIYMLVTGNSFWYKPVLEEGVNAGKTIEMYLLPSNDLEIIQGFDPITAPVKAYKLVSSNVLYDPKEVYHDKYFNPNFYKNSTLFGQSPIRAAANIVAKQNEAFSTEIRQFENQGPPYFIHRDSDDNWNTLSEPQKIEIEKEITDISKKQRQGGGMVLKDKFNIIKLGLSPADLNIIESTQDGRRILCNVYQFPVALFNDPEGSTYNNVTTARKSAWTDALIPHNNRYANSLTRFLIKPVEEYRKQRLFYYMDYSKVEELQSGLKDKVDWMTRAHWSANQILQATGKNRIDDPVMDEPIFSRTDVLLSELGFDSDLNKDFGDYMTLKAKEKSDGNKKS